VVPSLDIVHNRAELGLVHDPAAIGALGSIGLDERAYYYALRGLVDDSAAVRAAASRQRVLVAPSPLTRSRPSSPKDAIRPFVGRFPGFLYGTGFDTQTSGRAESTECDNHRQALASPHSVVRRWRFWRDRLSDCPEEASPP